MVPRAQWRPFQEERARIFASVGALGSLKLPPLPPFGTATTAVPQMMLVVPLRWGKGGTSRVRQHSAATAAAQPEAYKPCSAVERTPSLSTQVTKTQISPRPYLALKLGSLVWEMVLEPIHSSLL